MNEKQNTQSHIGDGITFDYNKLYANSQQTAMTETSVPETSEETTIQETPIIFKEDQTKQTEVISNVIPTFDTKILEGDENSNLNTNESLINSMKSESQREKDQYKNNLFFIIAFFGVLIFAVLFLFPLLSGY